MPVYSLRRVDAEDAYYANAYCAEAYYAKA